MSFKYDSFDDLVDSIPYVDEIVDDPERYRNTQSEAPDDVMDAQAAYDEIPRISQEQAQQYTDQFVADYHGYQTDPDNYQGQFTQEEASNAYDYMSRLNNYAPDSEWDAPDPNLDLFTTTIPDWEAAKAVQEKADADYQAPLDENQVFVQSVADANRQNNTAAQNAILDAGNMQSGSWASADESTRAAYTLVPGSRKEDDEDVHWLSKAVSPIIPSILAGSGGAAAGTIIGAGIGAGVGALFGGIGAAPGAAAGAAIGNKVGFWATALLNYVSQLTGWNIPVVNDTLEALDWASVQTEKAQGALGSAITVANKNLDGTDPSALELGKEIYKVLKENPDLFDVSGLSYEVGADFGTSELGRNIINAGAEGINNLFGTDIDIQEQGEVSRANTLQNGLFMTEEGTRGYNALYETYMPVYQQLRDACIAQGMSEEEAKQYAYSILENNVAKYHGTTGLLTDLTASSVADPANFVNFGEAALAEKVGKSTGDTSLARAGQAAKGNLIADALNIDAPKLGLRQSQGANSIFKIWQNGLQMKDVNTLSPFQKAIAGIDADGKLLDAKAVQGNWFKRMVSETNESRMYNLSNLNVDMVGSVMMDGSITPNMVGKLVDEITTGNVAPDSPLAQYQNSAIMNTLRDNYSMATPAEINAIKSEASRFAAYEPNRSVMNSVSQQTGMRADDLMAMMGSETGRRNIQDMLNRRNVTYDAGNGTVLQPADVYRAIEVFSPERHGQVYYSDARLKADVLIQLNDISDRYMLQHYDVPQTKWIHRLANLTKSIQSVELLNYSPSYLVNNFLNNMITRSAQGVGGIDSLSTQNLNARRGVSFARESDAYQRTKTAVDSSKRSSRRDLLSLAEGAWRNLEDGTVSGALIKGFNGLAGIEGMESKAAFDISVDRYWTPTWDNGKNYTLPEAEMLDAKFTPDEIGFVNDTVKHAANLEEVKSHLYGDVVTPEASTVLDAMLKANYADADADVIRNFMGMNPQVMDALTEAFKTQNDTTIRNAFQQVADTIASGMKSYERTQFAANYESMRNTLAAEGYAGFFREAEKIRTLQREVWVNQTVENYSFFNDVAFGRLANVDPDTRYAAITQQQTAEYNLLKGYDVQLAAAATEVFGMNNKTSYSLIMNTMNQYSIHEEYINAEHALYQKYKAEGWENYGSYVTEKGKILREALKSSVDSEAKCYSILVQHLRDNLDTKYTGLIDEYEQVTREIISEERRYNERQVKEAERRSNTSGRDHKIQVATRQEAGRIEGKESISDKRLRANQIFQSLEAAFPQDMQTVNSDFYTDTSIGWEDTLKVEFNYEKAKNLTEQAADSIHNANPENSKRKTGDIDFDNNEFFSTSQKTFRQRAAEIIQEAFGDDIRQYEADKAALAEAPALADREYNQNVQRSTDLMNEAYRDERGVYADEIATADKNYQTLRSALDSDYDSQSKSIDSKKYKNSVAKEAESYQRAVEKENKAFSESKKRTSIEKQYSKKIEAVKKKAAAAIAKAKEAAAIKALETKRDGDVAALEAERDATIQSEVTEPHNIRLQNIESQHQDFLDNTVAVHDKAMQDLDSRYQTALVNLVDLYNQKTNAVEANDTAAVRRIGAEANANFNQAEANLQAQYGKIDSDKQTFSDATYALPELEKARASVLSGEAAAPLGFLGADEIRNGNVTSAITDPKNPGIDVNVNEKGFPVMAVCEPFEVQTLKGGKKAEAITDTVRAGVYMDGKLVAYLTDQMPESLRIGEEKKAITVPVVGLSAENPKNLVVFVNNELRTVESGNPKGLDYSPYRDANYHPMRVGTTPDIEPWGDAALTTSPSIRQMLNKFEEAALGDISKQQTATGSNFWKGLNDEKRAVISRYLDGDLRASYSNQRFSAQRYAEAMVDGALLNYSKRYGFDNTLSLLMPYQFWMTRSVMEWGKRMIDKPQWFAMYARLNKLIEKNKKDFLPTRLEGLIGIPMPNLPDGLGSTLFVDPMSTVFPFHQFLNMTEYYEKDLHTIHNNTIRRIEDMYNQGQITDEEYDEAMEGKGELYKSIFAEERENDESDTGLSGLIGSFISPNILVDTALKAARGEGNKLSMTPMTRMGNLIKSAGDNTAAASITNMVGNAMQLPEKARRSAFGIDFNPEGTYAEYYANSYIANMLYTGDISYNQAVNAMAEGEGNPIYDKAKYLYGQTRAYGTQFGPLATEISQSIAGNKETSVQNMAGAAAASLFGAKVYSEGEQRYREQQGLLSEAKGMGKEATSEFYRQHPEYNVRKFAYEDDPEKRLHLILEQNLMNAYYSIPEYQRPAIEQAFGSEFRYKVIDKDTRCLEYIDAEKLIAWTQGLMGNVPNISSNNQGKTQTALKVDWYNQSVEGMYERYLKQKDQKFPGIDTVKQGYYALPANQRKQYLKDNPDLQQFWNWNDSVSRANPKLGAYLKEKSAVSSAYKYGNYDSFTEAIMSSVNDWTRQQVENYIQYGWAISTDAKHSLQIVYKNTGGKNGQDFDSWLHDLVGTK